MIGRRALVGLFAASPFMARSEVGGSEPMGLGGMCQGGSDISDPYGRLSESLHSRAHREIFRNTSRPASLEACIDTKRSWSPAFKEYVARSEARRRETLAHALEEVMYGEKSGLDRYLALQKLAAKLGVKP